MASPSVIAAEPSSSLKSRFGALLTNQSAVAFMAACVLIINVIVPPNRFADYPVYLVITDGLYYFNRLGWLDFEIGSNLLFLGLRTLTEKTDTAIDLAHYLLGGFFILFALKFARRNEVGWRGMLVMFALYGPLLAFVTIRATPAYMLVGLAALEASKGKASAIWLTLAATLFHVSAVLALAPVLAGLAQNRLAWFAWIGRSPRWLAICVGLTMVGMGWLRTTFTDALTSVIGSVPFLGKYVVYTSALDPQNGTVPQNGLSILHLIYLTMVSVFTLTMLLMPDEHCRRFRAYLLTSYAIFLVLEFSPVTAYRQSQFWMIPAVLIFPWQRFAPEGLRSIVFILVFVAMFFYAVPGVIW